METKYKIRFGNKDLDGKVFHAVNWEVTGREYLHEFLIAASNQAFIECPRSRKIFIHVNEVKEEQ